MFKVENKQLVNLTLCLPDENGIPIEETLLDKSAILRKVAQEEIMSKLISDKYTQWAQECEARFHRHLRLTG